MTSVIWLDPINRDAHFLKLIAENIYELVSNYHIGDIRYFKVIASNRTNMELNGKIPFKPFFKKFKYLELGQIKPSKKLLLILDYYSGFRRLAQELKPDSDSVLLYSSGLSFPEIEWLGLQHIRSKVKRMIMLVHNLEDKQSNFSFLSYQRNRNLLSCFDRWIFLSEHMRSQAVSSFNLDLNRTYVMKHPHFHSMLEGIQIDNHLRYKIEKAAKNRPIISYISRLDLSHGIDIFYQLLQQLQTQGIDVYGIVLGRLSKGWTLGKNQNFLKALGLHSTQLLLKPESYTYSELLAVLNMSDFVLAPYRDISQSGSIALALGEKVPVIASDVGANREMIKHGINGLLFNLQDLDLLVNEIKLTYGSGATMRERFLPIEDFNLHLDPFIAVEKMLEWIQI